MIPRFFMVFFPVVSDSGTILSGDNPPFRRPHVFPAKKGIGEEGRPRKAFVANPTIYSRVKIPYKKGLMEAAGRTKNWSRKLFSGSGGGEEPSGGMKASSDNFTFLSGMFRKNERLIKFL
ncbi:MAG: hypothetical protein ACLFRG_13755 [Desulfococcaceae bacterium]